jgi:hypothetical protein
MSNKQPLSDLELAKTVLVGIGAIALSCAGLWLIGFTLGVIK